MGSSAVRVARTGYRAYKRVKPVIDLVRANGNDGVTYGDYSRTGHQDCDNALDFTEFELRDYPGKTPRQIVRDTFARWEEDGDLQDMWIADNAADFGDLDPHRAYNAWKSAWMSCAEGHLEKKLAKEGKMTKRNPKDRVFLVGRDQEGDTYAVEVDDIEDGRDSEARLEQLYELLDVMMLDRRGTYHAWYVRADDPGWARLEKKKVSPFTFTYPLRQLKNPGADDASDDLRVSDGMARAIWVTSYASWVEDIEDDAKRRRLSARGGEDWSDVAPETPASADEAAAELAKLFYHRNGLTLSELLKRAAKADRQRVNDAYAESFGHNLAMEAMGHGVSWFDDHETFEIQFPDFEAYTGDGKSVDWSPRAGRGTRYNPDLTPESLALFLKLARDADNWSGTPMIDVSAAQRGNLTALKRKKLLTTFHQDGDQWAEFTEAGVELAAKHGIHLTVGRT